MVERRLLKRIDGKADRKAFRKERSSEPAIRPGTWQADIQVVDPALKGRVQLAVGGDLDSAMESPLNSLPFAVGRRSVSTTHDLLAW